MFCRRLQVARRRCALGLLHREARKASSSVRQVVVRPQLAAVIPAFQDAVDAHRGHPTSCTVYKDGEIVLQLYSGTTPQGTQFGPSHVSTVQSVSKAVMGLAAVMLQDRGQLQLDAPVVKYWPEFQTKDITVREILSHTAGLYTFQDKRPQVFFRDRASPAVANYLADANHFDRSLHGKVVYHGMTGGLFFSQICSRVDPAGRFLDDFCREEIFEPLDLDMQFGMSQKEFDSCREGLFCRPGFPPTDVSDTCRSLLPTALQKRLFAGKVLNGIMPIAMPTVRSVLPFSLVGVTEILKYGLLGPSMFVNEMGSGNLITNTSALGKLGAILAAGGGSLLSSADAINRASVVFAKGYDPVFQRQVAFSECGWSPVTLFSQDVALQAASAEENGLVGWWGIGGQLWVFSRARNLSFAFQSSYCVASHNLEIPAYQVLKAVLLATQ